MTDSNILRIGDYVTLKNAHFRTLLCAEGILLEDIISNDHVRVLDDCLFCVHLQRQYSAARELDEFLKTKSGNNSDDGHAAKYFQALKRGSDNENKLNDSYMKKKLGHVVVFGDIIQLFHVKSGKYLTIIPDLLARDERENIRVALNTNGNSFSWLQVLPRFKIDREGDRILSRSEVYFRVAERANEYIHRADRDPLAGHAREINCSLEPTSWRLTIFQSSTDSVDRSTLLASQLVYINDPETRCNLTISMPCQESLVGDYDEEKMENNKGAENPANMEEEEFGMSVKFFEEPESPADASVDTEKHTFTHENGDFILQQYTNFINTDSLWFVEARSLLTGGPIRLKTDKVRLKHMNTGRYLLFTTIEQKNEETDEVEEVAVLTTTHLASLPGTLLSVNEVNGSSKYLTYGKALQIGNEGAYIQRGEATENKSYFAKGTYDKSFALNLILHRYTCSTVGIEAEEEEEDVASPAPSVAPSSKEPQDVYVGLAARGYLRKYYHMTSEGPYDSKTSTLWATATRSDMEFFRGVVQKVVYFSQGFPISSKDVQLGIDKADGVVRIQRQHLLREQRTLEVVLRMINRLVPISEKMDEIKNAPVKKRKTVVSDAEQSTLLMGRMILSMCFNLLYYSILDNQVNQIYVADHMAVLLVHLSTQPLAGKCVTEMLSKNIELQETKVGDREIQIFVDKLRSSKMNAMYLQMLQACCSCEGQGVDNNQCKVAVKLFEDTNDIIINMRADYSHLTKVDWGQPTLYVPETALPGSPIEGDILITKGLPVLSLAWTTNSIDFSPLGLFGKLSVNVADLFAVQKLDDGHRRVRSKKKSSQDQKDAVANYFIAELFLGAEMCMDRNYVAMHKLDELFTYEMLVTILKINVSNNLKSAAVRLLMCLYVDRDPQAVSKIPLLTRTWSDIEKNVEPQLPYVDPGRRYKFALIQQLISEHITEMAGSRWDELSRHMLKMLRTMVSFNFYGTNERMTDVISPLILALDRRSVGVAEENEIKRVVAQQAAVERMENRESRAITDMAGNNNSPVFHLLGEVNDSRDIMEEGARPEEMVELDSPGVFEQIKNAVCCPLNALSSGRSARVVSVDEVASNSVDGFQVPLRYSKAPIYELETMVEAVDILAFAQRVIEDRNVSVLLRYFYSWQSGADKRSPPELFDLAVAEAEKLTVDIADFNNVMLDVLMFVHTPLMQSTLEVLMAHHSMRRILLENAGNVQLLASHHRERQYRQVDQILQQLEQNAETHELWGVLETEEHRKKNKQTKDILKDLTNLCRVRRVVLEYDEEFMADPEIQDLYRNLGCFEICMKVMGLLDSVDPDEDGNYDEVSLNTRDLCLQCNTLLFWYFLGNPKNQEQGFGEIEFFMDSIDGDINSHKIITALFKNNEALMRTVSHQHLQDLVELIMKNGKSHHYLALFAAISHVGDRNIVENQLEIVKTLTSPGRFDKVKCYFCPVDDPEYEEKIELMEPFLNKEEDLSLDDLPPLLAYHLTFLEVLSGCTVGRMNITTVEAKVQSVFNFQDILDSILHEGTMTTAKTRLCKFFYNSVIEVELRVPGLEQDPRIWRLLESFKSVLNEAKEKLVNAEKLGWESVQVSRQRIEYILVAVMTIGGFFQHYYRANAFQSDERGVAAAAAASSDAPFSSAASSKANNKTVAISLSHVDELILFFFNKIKDVHELNSKILSAHWKKVIFDALDTLNKSTSGGGLIVAHLKPLGKGGVEGEIDEDEEELEVPVDAEQTIIANYKTFLAALAADTDVQYKANNENVAFITILEKLPFIAEPCESDVRYETLIRKLVHHIRENITIMNGQKRLDARVTKTSTWIIRAFRTMIENKMGMSIYQRDDEGGQEEDEAAQPVVNALNNCGATALCLELIADGIDKGLQMEAVKLGVGLLFKEGGALEVQGIMYNHLCKTQSDLFFRQVRLTFQALEAWHSWNEIIILKEDEEPSPPDEILIVRFLQLMCEGHYLPNQDILREQPSNNVSYNLLDDFVSYFNCLSRIPCRTSSAAAIRLSATILEVIQGPCEGNQAHFALNTELIETLNRITRAKLINDCIEDEEVEVKKTAIDIFQGLLEGQGEKSPVYERVLSVIHLDIIQIMSKGFIITKDTEEGEIVGNDDEELKEQKEILQTECVVLLQMLCNFKPSLYEELGISRNIEDIVGSGTAMIEVIWRGDIHRRFFHVPAMCSYLAKSSKDTLVEEVDRSNSENKLIDFLARSHELYREAKHQQLLTQYKMSTIFSRKNQDRATWITFILALLTNLFLLLYYTSSDMDAVISEEAAKVVQYLNLVQIIFSAFVIVLFLVVRSPVRFQSLQSQDKIFWECAAYTALDPMTMYYSWYLSFSILGQVYSYDFLPFLLLDLIVKNSTTRDVLNAVIVPRQQILMGGVIILFVVQIYSFFLFLYYRNDIVNGHHYCDTLYGCFKTGLGYGLQLGGGIGYLWNQSLGTRWVLDVSFFFVVNVGMLNLVGGVIITTFGQLRENQARIKEDTEGLCFICNIDRQVFDRASTEPEGFKTHIKVDHNMWNYLYFIFLLWEQDKDDDDGLEQYVRRAIDKNEINWFPMNKAIRLDQAASTEDALLYDLKKSILKSELSVAGKLDKFQTSINIVLEQLNQTLKQDHIQDRVETAPSTAKRRNKRPSAPVISVDLASKERDEKDRAVLGKTILLELVEISGFHLPLESHESLLCNITADHTVMTVPCNPIHRHTVTFAGEHKFKLMERVSALDKRVCVVSIVKQSSKPYSVQEVAAVNIPVDDLLLAEGSVLEVFFQIQGAGPFCKLAVVPYCSSLTE